MMSGSDLFSVWAGLVIQSWAIGFFTYGCVWLSIRAKTPRAPRIHHFAAIVMTVAVTGTVRFGGVFVVGLRAIEDLGMPPGLLLAVIPAMLSSAFCGTIVKKRALRGPAAATVQGMV